ncbi:MAG: protein kinase domain-containing protein [Blastocatellia bacterium]
MNAIQMQQPAAGLRNLEEEWRRLADEFLPIHSDESENWRYSRRMGPDDPPQGWKLHISATILNAAAVFKACAPYLRSRNILFKAARTIDILGKLNSGIIYGFSQVGKFITVYPQTTALALKVAADLHELTREFQAPPVPYDLPYRPNSLIHYRYGGFQMIEVELAGGQRSTAIRDPAGKLWTDKREPGTAVPVWVQNPFEVFAEEADPSSPLCTQFLTYDALSQRGKGGVYLAIDLRRIPARKCVLKEGRRLGEVSIDGRDGRDFVAYEEGVLKALSACGLPVPEVLASFDVAGHRYLALEYIEGDNLMEICSHPRRKLPLATADALAARIAELVARVHEAGWVWRDCKPLNFITSSAGEVRPLDFEGAVRVNEPTSIIWGTRGYTPPELKHGPVTGTNLPEDLYALGATLHQLYTSLVPIEQGAGNEPQVARRPAVGALRKGMSADTRRIIDALLDPDPRSRPTAREAAAGLMKRVSAEPIVIQASKHRRRFRKKDLQNRAQPLVEKIPGVERLIIREQAPPAAALA